MFNELKKKISNSKNASSLVDSYLTGVYFKRKKKEYKYPYRVYSPFEIGLAEQGLDDFYLVGKNWLNTNLPVIVAVGCNDWKLGFLADYLPEYRVAFLPRKKVGINAVCSIRKVKIQPEAVLIWGYTESRWLAKYLNIKNFKVWRVEDGFLRSAELGAAHTTPYSLVIDKSGFYYNCYSQSDVEKLLNNYDFLSDKTIIDRAEECLQRLKSMGLSKYNPPVSQKIRKSRTRKRIAVLGQVDKDSSIKYGNPNSWTSEDLVKLAYAENPGCEIYYRPHPEVFRGFQKSSFRKRKLEKICVISSPEIDIVNFIESVDHVYTITSLSGFEAVIRGKEVTVVGAPFYAGWGITDDRVSIPRRKRDLNILEVFAVTYLVYPRYLANLESSYEGFLSTCLKIRSDQYVDNESFFKKRNYSKESLIEGLSTFKWPQLLLQEDEGFSFIEKLVYVNFTKIFMQNVGSIYPLTVCLYILGELKDEKNKDIFLEKIRDKQSIENLNKILLLLSSQKSESNYLYKHWAWLFQKKGMLLNSEINNQLIFSEPEMFAEEYSGSSALISLETMLENRHYEDFLNFSFELLSRGLNSKRVIMLIMDMTDLQFDYISKSKLALFLQGINIYEFNRLGIYSEFTAVRFNNVDDEEVIRLASNLMLLRPELTSVVKMYVEEFVSNGKEKWWPRIESFLNLDSQPEARRVQAYLALEKFDEALILCKELIESNVASEKLIVLYAQCLAYCGYIKEACKHLEMLLLWKYSKAVVSELLKVYVLADEYAKARKVLKQAEINKLEIGDMHKRKIYFGNRELEKAFNAFTEMSIVEKFKKYYYEKYYDFDRVLDREKEFLLIAIFGPGDEIRFASIYNRLNELLSVDKISITCSPKLTMLMRRSFPNLRFVEVARIRSTDKVDLDQYSEVPGSDIMGFIDNTAVEAIEKAQSVAFVTDMLHHLLKDYDSFDRGPYLQPNQSRVISFQERLPKAKKLVGISWRSSLTTTARNLHYLSIEQLMPLFDIAGIQFVNFQYDDCAEEISYINSIYPGKIIDFAEIDHYNDFDSVAALMQCMDLIISPATTVAELAGAIGCKTWLFSNSTEIDWRKTDTAGRDVWHSETEIIDVPEKGNKEMLVNKLKHRLIEFVSE